MQAEICEEIVKLKSEELLLHASFVQHTTPQDAFAQALRRVRINSSQLPMSQVNSATTLIQSFLERARRPMHYISRSGENSVQNRHGPQV